jgi:hypothetical protein
MALALAPTEVLPNILFEKPFLMKNREAGEEP